MYRSIQTSILNGLLSEVLSENFKYIGLIFMNQTCSPNRVSVSVSVSSSVFFRFDTAKPKAGDASQGNNFRLRLRLFMMLRRLDIFNKNYLIKFITDSKQKLITCFNSTLKCEIEVIKRKNVCVCVYLVLQSVSVVRFTRLCLTATKPNLPLQKHRTMARYAAN